MKTLLLPLSGAAVLAIAAGMLSGSPARAQVEYPWCAITSINTGTPACDYSTREQCQASILGGAGFCQPNARAAPQAQMPRRGVR
jgi:hypothetical protein